MIQYKRTAHHVTMYMYIKQYVEQEAVQSEYEDPKPLLKHQTMIPVVVVVVVFSFFSKLPFASLCKNLIGGYQMACGLPYNHPNRKVLIPSLKLTLKNGGWKLISYWEGNFSGANC